MIAVLFTYVPSTGENFATPIDWGDDPIAHAYALKDSCFDDFPGAVWSIGADKEATDVHAAALTKELFGEEPT